MAQSVSSPALAPCRQFTLPDYLTALDAFQAVTSRDSEYRIPIVHRVLEHKILVREEHGDEATAFMREAGIEVTGETILHPTNDLWLVADPAEFPEDDAA